MNIPKLRGILLITAASAIFATSATSAGPEKDKYLAYVGTYTTSGEWRGTTASRGIYVYDYDSVTGQLSKPRIAAEASDPSFVVVHPNGNYLYAANELEKFGTVSSGTLSAYAIDKHNGKLKLLNKVASGGLGPCFLSFDKTGRYLFAANYDGGSISVFPIGKDGALGPATSRVQHEGSGADKARQEGPHAHWIGASPDNRFVLAADLGLDKVLVYRFDPATGKLTPNDPAFVKLAPGSGPRHFAFHPSGKFGYAITEMGAGVTAFSFDSKTGALKPLQTLSTLPADYTGPREDAEILVHPNGNFLYTSNRGHDSITIYSINPVTGTLTLVGYVPTQGKTPRAFAIDPSGTHLLAANQDGHSIVVFKIDTVRGVLISTGQHIEVDAPTSIDFLPLP